MIKIFAWPKLFVFLLLSIHSLAFSNDFSPQQRLEQIDEQIEQLKEKQIKYKSKAVRYQDEADRWQFDPGLFNEARYARKQVEINRAKVNELQKQIDALNAEKEEILKEHPELDPSS